MPAPVYSDFRELGAHVYVCVYVCVCDGTSRAHRHQVAKADGTHEQEREHTGALGDQETTKTTNSRTWIKANESPRKRLKFYSLIKHAWARMRRIVHGDDDAGVCDLHNK